jgi:UDP-N-acetyl-2-amino-2-deoxyglucuronate dehydrogenase
MTVSAPRFALLGAAGYVAPRHLEAMLESRGTLTAACDPHDSVGLLDRYFFDARFFQEFERFDRHLDKLRRSGSGVDFVSICTPNYLHDAHIRFALRSGADAICEKPLVINPWNIAPLEELAEETGRRIWPVLPLREHPTWQALLEATREQGSHRFDVELSYITSRGSWYLNSWKGKEERSGGLAGNIGIHFFDALLWVFGPAAESELHIRTATELSGTLRLERADVRWFLSIDRERLPREAKEAGQGTYRSVSVDGSQLEFSDGFTSLHTLVYRKILQGQGCSPKDARPAIELTRQLRETEVSHRSSSRTALFLRRFF